ncbi:hypothetical protein [Amycolatopsis sp.]|uniref:hypothetical protein n=1 Tax=Amycolatopsis sp. TaxID=37632 RepID=UPI002E02FE2D|nr:hypothetical protein [Amycolatopsis sp.]
MYVRAQHPFVVGVVAYIAPAPGEYRYDLLAVDEIQPPADSARGLGLERETTVIRLRVIYDNDRRPIEASVLIKGGYLYELSCQQDIPTP